METPESLAEPTEKMRELIVKKESWWYLSWGEPIRRRATEINF
jgi:hypothetical protein